MALNHDIATPTFQQVLELRRLNTERGLEPFDARDLPVQRAAITGPRALWLVDVGVIDEPKLSGRRHE